MKRWVLTLLLLFIDAHPLGAVAKSPTQLSWHALLREKFDGDEIDLEMWKYSGSRVALETIDNDSGRTKSLHFVLDPNSSEVPFRSELELKNPRSFDFQKRFRYSFRILVPIDWKVQSGSEIVAQWHARPDNERAQKGRFPCVTLRIATDRWFVRINSNPLSKQNNASKTLTSISKTLPRVEFGKWTDWTFEIKWSYLSDGEIKVLKDNKLIFSYNGANCYNDKNGPYMKIGIYKPEWKVPPSKPVSPRSLFVDDIEVLEAAGD